MDSCSRCKISGKEYIPLSTNIVLQQQEMLFTFLPGEALEGRRKSRKLLQHSESGSKVRRGGNGVTAELVK